MIATAACKQNNFCEPKDDEDSDLGGGMKVLDSIMEAVEVNPKNHKPKDECRVVIEACGQI